VTATEFVITQPLASVTVTVYVPAESPVAEAPVPPEGDHEYEYEGVPPLTLTETEPVAPPLHKAGVDDITGFKGVGWETVAVAVFTHPFASVTVTV